MLCGMLKTVKYCYFIDISIIFVSMKITKKEHLSDLLFYSIEKAIKSYRQYAQRMINENGFNITIDQWLVLKTISENPDQTQHQVAETVFKDHASLTRIIELLVKKNYLQRVMHPDDRRRFRVTLTREATEILKKIQPVVEKYRSTALNGIAQSQSDELRQTLKLIINNCQS